jgi:hypothetical protein
MLGYPIRQIAYYVEDVEAAARRHSALFGSGPFLEFDPFELEAVHRGVQVAFETKAVFGQWGALQVELLQQDDLGPSVLRDLYPLGSGRGGIHHMAMFVDDLALAVDRFAKAGHAEVMRVSSRAFGVSAVFVDTCDVLGHYIELYEPVAALRQLYATVAAAAEGFDGDEPVRRLKE